MDYPIMAYLLLRAEHSILFVMTKLYSLGGLLQDRQSTVAPSYSRTIHAVRKISS